MSELLQAAKDMVEWFNSATAEDAPVDNLCAAVERAEKQEAVAFDEWWESTGKKRWPHEYAATQDAWTAAQQAERERLWNGVIIAVERLKTIDTEGLLSGFTDRILEAADNECKEIKTAAQQAERERIRARAKLAAEKTWKAEDRYIFPKHHTIEKFVDALLEDGDRYIPMEKQDAKSG